MFESDSLDNPDRLNFDILNYIFSNDVEQKNVLTELVQTIKFNLLSETSCQLWRPNSESFNESAEVFYWIGTVHYKIFNKCEYHLQNRICLE